MEDGRSWIGVEMVLLVVEEEEPVVLEDNGFSEDFLDIEFTE